MYICDFSELINEFLFLEGKVVIGKIISMYKDGKIVRINKEIKCKITRTETRSRTIGLILEPNPVEELGLPLPSYFLIIAYKFEKESDQEKVIFPIAQNILLKKEGTHPISRMKLKGF